MSEHRYQRPIRGRNEYDPPASSPVTAHRVGARLDALEQGDPVAVAPLSAAERLALLEERARNTSSTLEQHSEVHRELSTALNRLVERFEGIERKLLIGIVVIFAGTTNGTHVAELVSHLLQ
jgi:hypothetical protein